MIRFALTVLVGAALGAAVGYYRECVDGSCPLHPTWWKGAALGAALAALAAAIVRRWSRRKSPPESSNP